MHYMETEREIKISDKALKIDWQFVKDELVRIERISSARNAGAREGGGHFTVSIVSRHFTGTSLLQRHRMVYGALQDLLPGEIHALSIKAFSPEEFQPSTTTT